MTATSASPVAMVAGIATVAGKFLIRVVLQGLMILLLVFAVLSWVQPGAPVMGTLDRLVSPLLNPVRQFIPRLVAWICRCWCSCCCCRSPCWQWAFKPANRRLLRQLVCGQGLCAVALDPLIGESAMVKNGQSDRGERLCG